MPGFYMKCYTGMKWVKREYSLTQISGPLNKTFILLRGPEIQAKIASHSGDCVLGDSQLYSLPLMVRD